MTANFGLNKFWPYSVSAPCRLLRRLAGHQQSNRSPGPKCDGHNLKLAGEHKYFCFPKARTAKIPFQYSIVWEPCFLVQIITRYFHFAINLKLLAKKHRSPWRKKLGSGIGGAFPRHRACQRPAPFAQTTSSHGIVLERQRLSSQLRD